VCEEGLHPDRSSRPRTTPSSHPPPLPPSPPRRPIDRQLATRPACPTMLLLDATPPLSTVKQPPSPLVPSLRSRTHRAPSSSRLSLQCTSRITHHIQERARCVQATVHPTNSGVSHLRVGHWSTDSRSVDVDAVHSSLSIPLYPPSSVRLRESMDCPRRVDWSYTSSRPQIHLPRPALHYPEQLV
jgi:hypothetical protein